MSTWSKSDLKRISKAIEKAKDYNISEFKNKNSRLYKRYISIFNELVSLVKEEYYIKQLIQLGIVKSLIEFFYLSVKTEFYELILNLLKVLLNCSYDHPHIIALLPVLLSVLIASNNNNNNNNNNNDDDDDEQKDEEENEKNININDHIINEKANKDKEVIEIDDNIDDDNNQVVSNDDDLIYKILYKMSKSDGKQLAVYPKIVELLFETLELYANIFDNCFKLIYQTLVKITQIDGQSVNKQLSYRIILEHWIKYHKNQEFIVEWLNLIIELCKISICHQNLKSNYILDHCIVLLWMYYEVEKYTLLIKECVNNIFKAVSFFSVSEIGERWIKNVNDRYTIEHWPKLMRNYNDDISWWHHECGQNPFNCIWNFCILLDQNCIFCLKTLAIIFRYNGNKRKNGEQIIELPDTSSMYLLQLLEQINENNENNIIDQTAINLSFCGIIPGILLFCQPDSQVAEKLYYIIYQLYAKNNFNMININEDEQHKDVYDELDNDVSINLMIPLLTVIAYHGIICELKLTNDMITFIIEMLAHPHIILSNKIICIRLLRLMVNYNSNIKLIEIGSITHQSCLSWFVHHHYNLSSSRKSTVLLNINSYYITQMIYANFNNFLESKLRCELSLPLTLPMNINSDNMKFWMSTDMSLKRLQYHYDLLGFFIESYEKIDVLMNPEFLFQFLLNVSDRLRLYVLKHDHSKQMKSKDSRLQVKQIIDNLMLNGHILSLVCGKYEITTAKIKFINLTYFLLKYCDTINSKNYAIYVDLLKYISLQQINVEKFKEFDSCCKTIIHILSRISMKNIEFIEPILYSFYQLSILLNSNKFSTMENNTIKAMLSWLSVILSQNNNIKWKSILYIIGYIWRLSKVDHSYALMISMHYRTLALLQMFCISSLSVVDKQIIDNLYQVLASKVDKEIFNECIDTIFEHRKAHNFAPFDLTLSLCGLMLQLSKYDGEASINICQKKQILFTSSILLFNLLNNSQTEDIIAIECMMIDTFGHYTKYIKSELQYLKNFWNITNFSDLSPYVRDKLLILMRKLRVVTKKELSLSHFKAQKEQDTIKSSYLMKLINSEYNSL